MCEHRKQLTKVGKNANNRIRNNGIMAQTKAKNQGNKLNIQTYVWVDVLKDVQQWLKFCDFSFFPSTKLPWAQMEGGMMVILMRICHWVWQKVNECSCVCVCWFSVLLQLLETTTTTTVTFSHIKIALLWFLMASDNAKKPTNLKIVTTCLRACVGVCVYVFAYVLSDGKKYFLSHSS